MATNNDLGKRGNKRGATAKLSREEIVRAARQLIEAEGPDALSMRRLAGVVKSSPMALYHHVDGRADLLAAVLQEICAELPQPLLPDDPQERMVRLAVIMQQIMLEHPWSLEILSTNTTIGPDALWFVEEFLGSAREAGLSERQAGVALLSAWRVMIGNVSVALNLRAIRASEDDPWFVGLSQESAERAPLFTSIAPRWLELENECDPDVTLAPIIAAIVSDARTRADDAPVRAAV
ncbi:TetR/AcrR family transcriptional regulator [Hoyosella sp. G463]|uniref:TetR/AcrR family transcriptional regulator n=1 Tax=Lolliginicoccus lacisalsi TaxID=2742202 RepID=A0A927JEA6_9ACTN|nr:TetR/AcrR family transcriptional regulator [Lolliginicoccus lacisalsi]